MSACLHCGEVSPAGERFCCRGCEAVYGALHDAGLADYYRLRDSSPSPASTVATAFTAPELAAAVRRERGRCVVDLAVDGMHCASCAWVIEEALREQPGVSEVRASLSAEFVRLVLDSSDEALPGAVAGLAERLARFGYRARPRPPLDDGDQGAARRDLLRLGVAAACAMNLMLFSVSLYGGERFGIDRSLQQMFRWLSLGLSLPIVFYAAQPILRRAGGSLRTGSIHVDVPVAVAIAVMWGSSVVATVRGEGHVWFDSLGMLVALLLGGRFLEASVRRRARRRLTGLLGRTLPTARRADGAIVAAEELAVGDLLALLPGDVVPADAVVTQGHSDIDRSVLDGEPRPRPAAPGLALPAGARVLTGRLTARVVRAASESTVARTRQRVEDCLAERAPIQLLADRVARVFVVLVLLAALGSYLLWLPVDPGRALSVAVAVLVVACPCALALATPLAFAAAVHGAAARGLLPRSGQVLLQLATVDVAAFDKTGTLTEPSPGLRAWDGDDETLALAAAVGAASLHPVSRAVVREAEARGLARQEASDCQEEPGLGVRGRVGGRDVAIGRPGATVTVDGVVRAVGRLDEELRPGAQAAIDALQRRGIRCAVLSGDEPTRVAALARRLGIDEARGGMLPADKFDQVRAWRRDGRTVLFLGDGLNDASTLAEADVGFAVAGAVDVSVGAADGLVDASGLTPLLDGIARGRALRRVLLSNLALSAGYNLLAVAGAASGIVGPLEAAALMPLSSLIVVVRSSRVAGPLRSETAATPRGAPMPHPVAVP